jgi:hypothetical protein
MVLVHSPNAEKMLPGSTMLVTATKHFKQEFSTHRSILHIVDPEKVFPRLIKQIIEKQDAGFSPNN